MIEFYTTLRDLGYKPAYLIVEIPGYMYAYPTATIWITNRMYHGMQCAYQYYPNLKHYCEIRVYPNEYYFL